MRTRTRTPKRQDNRDDNENDDNQCHSTPNHSCKQLLAWWKWGARGWEMGDENKDGGGGRNSDGWISGTGDKGDCEEGAQPQQGETRDGREGDDDKW